MAAQGKLSTKRRPNLKKNGILESPCKQNSTRTSSIWHEDNASCMGHSMDDGNQSCLCASTNRISFWPSQESRDLDSNYGCGDTASVSENNDSYDTFNFPG